MRLTVDGFARRYSFSAADASKMLKRAEIGAEISSTMSAEFKATYTGSFERFDAIAQRERDRIAARNSTYARNLKSVQKTGSNEMNSTKPLNAFHWREQPRPQSSTPARPPRIRISTSASAKRIAEIVRMRKDGMSYSKIGKALGISASQAWKSEPRTDAS